MVNFPKGAQAGRYSRKKLKPVDEPEDDLQEFTNEYCDASGVFFWRVPNNTKCTALAGFPDNLLKEYVGGNFSLVMDLELKTKSQLHGRQKTLAHAFNYRVAQTPDEVEKAVTEFRMIADKVKKYIKSLGVSSAKD